MAILTELKDPRVRDVTVTHVEMTPDMREAKVFVSIMGDATHQNLTLRGLENSRGFLQSKIAERIETRYTPRLRFVVDMGVKRSIEVAEILDRVLEKDKRPNDEAADDESADDDSAAGAATLAEEQFADATDDDPPEEPFPERPADETNRTSTEPH